MSFGRVPMQVATNTPLLVLGGGAAAVFVSNVVAKAVFTGAQFVDWAYLSSLTTLFFAFSLLGSEQLVVRTAKEAGGSLEFPRELARYIGGSFIVFVLLYYFVLDGRIFSYRLGVYTIPVLFSISAIQIVHQMERARGRLLASQLALNAWKFALLPFVWLAALVLPAWRAEVATAGALLIGLGFVVLLFRRAQPHVLLSTIRTDTAKVFFPFMLSLGIMAVLNVGDRIVLEKVHVAEDFAGYVYLVTILATPFAILANYFGFKEAVRYRREYSRAVLRRDAARAMLIAAALVAAWMLLCYFTRRLCGVTFEPKLWALLAVLSVVRCGYGVLSAAMGVRGGAGAIYLANLLTLGSLVAFGWWAIAAHASVLAIAAGYTIVWGVRSVGYFWLLEASFSTPASQLQEG